MEEEKWNREFFFRLMRSRSEPFQKFTLTPNNDCTYYVQTYGGYYLTVGEGEFTDGTYYSLLATTSDITQAVRWRLWLRAVAPTT